MLITSTEFISSAVSPTQYPVEIQPEIVLVGRSNVGKSSLINKFINRKGLARTSSQPGKTQTINFYHINKAWFFVDLPGYGFAKVSKETRSTWGKFIENYLLKRPQICGIIQIIDLRHPPSKDDILMAEWLHERQAPILVVATKADKVPRGQWGRHAEVIRRELMLASPVPLVIFSSTSGNGLATLTEWVEGCLVSFAESIKKGEDNT